MTVILFAMLMTTGVGMGALVSLVLYDNRTARRAGQVPVTWVAIWALIVAVGCSLAYRKLYASTLEIWPHGYPDGGP
jgi:hypothetical protein